MIKQYLTFLIDDTQYAIDVFQIQEVLEYEEPQPIPCSSPMLLGIIRSRDSNIAIMDLRKRFGLKPRINDKMTRTIVLEIPDPEEGVINLFGIIADSVLEVIEIDDENLDVLPTSKNIKGSKFVTSVLSLNDRYLLILDTAKIFSNEDLDTAFDATENSFDNKTENTEVSQKKNRTRKSKTKTDGVK
ncbi:MAG: chemotaxis protein CheW [Treponema sp.]|nr:chemotaxis protein CheW [Candidatus Treponema merdequi]